MKKYGFVFSGFSVIYGPYATKEKAIADAKIQCERALHRKHATIEVGIFEVVDLDKYIKRAAKEIAGDVLRKVVSELDNVIIARNREKKSSRFYKLEKDNEWKWCGVGPSAVCYKRGAGVKLKSALLSVIQENLTSNTYQLKNTEVIEL